MASMTPAQAPPKAAGEASTSNVIDVPPMTRELFEKYSLIAPDDVAPHIAQIRDRALEVHPYGCLHELSFLKLSFVKHPLYPEILARLRGSSQTFLNMGCLFGQTIRKLVYDGAPSASLYGVDNQDAFLSLGYDLFKDRSKLESKFIAGDIFSMDLTSIQGTIDIVEASLFFHLFNRPKQLLVVQKFISLLRPVPGSVVVGSHLGSLKPGEYKTSPDRPIVFRHDPDSFAELWKEASVASGSHWKVDSSLDTYGIVGNEHRRWAEPNCRRMVFTVTRE